MPISPSGPIELHANVQFCAYGDHFWTVYSESLVTSVELLSLAVLTVQRAWTTRPRPLSQNMDGSANSRWLTGVNTSDRFGVDSFKPGGGPKVTWYCYVGMCPFHHCNPLWQKGNKVSVCSHFQLLIQTESAIKELSFDVRFKSLHLQRQSEVTAS